MNLDSLIRAVQKSLGVEVDGKPGPETWAAIYNKIVREPAGKPEAEPDQLLNHKVDERSERVISSLLPEVHPYARALVTRAAAAGIQVKIISGTRTYAEQEALYAQGRTKPGKRVTNARGGYSNHNFGIAFDVGIFEGTKYLGESPKYKAVGAIGSELGLDWGGNWTSIKDEPHFQLRPQWAANLPERVMLAQLRVRVAEASPVYV